MGYPAARANHRFQHQQSHRQGQGNLESVDAHFADWAGP